MKPVILHLSNDYPDPMAPDKTRAVINLVEGSPEFRHVVYSLNRVDGWSGISSLAFGEDRIAVAYRALPKGLFWESRLRDLAHWILDDLKSRGIRPDLVEAHKFTVEGLAAQQIAETLNIPLVCDIQGDTDTRILGTKVNLRARYRAIAERASVVFPYAPWPVAQFQRETGLKAEKCRLLPVIPGIDTLSPGVFVPENRLLTVFHLDSWKRKNISGVMAAMKKLKDTLPDLTLDVYGRGSPASTIEVMKTHAASGLGNAVTFKGPAPNGQLPDLMKNYAAFVQPSKRESYGLVYIESLFSGLPVLMPKDRGIDGYLDTAAIGYACDPHSVDDIAQGIGHILKNQASLKQSVASLQASGGLNALRRDAILKTYKDGLSQALSGR